MEFPIVLVVTVAAVLALRGLVEQLACRILCGGCRRSCRFLYFATLIFRFSQLIFFGFHVFRQGRATNSPNLRTSPS